MDYGYKLTTNGRRVLVALGALEQPLKITRVEVGDGMVPEGINLADMHQLVHPVTEGTVGDRRHEDDRLYLTVQYSNQGKTDVKTFYLSEFIVYATDPETGKETDLIYGTMGDYRQPVPAYSPSMPASVWNFPLVIVVSDEIEVSIAAPAGLVTYDELTELLGSGILGVYSTEITIPATGWEADTDTQGAYARCVDIPLSCVTASMVPNIIIHPQGQNSATGCGLADFAQTLHGAVRVYAQKAPAAPIPASLALLGMSPYISAELTAADNTAGAEETMEMLRDIFGPTE